MNNNTKNKLANVAKQVSFPIIMGSMFCANGVRVTGMYGENIATIDAGNVSAALIGVTVALAIRGFIATVYSVNEAFNGKQPKQ